MPTFSLEARGPSGGPSAFSEGTSVQQSSSANFWSGLAVVAQRRSIRLSVLSAVCSGISVAFIALGGPLENPTDRRQVTVGILAIVGFVGLTSTSSPAVVAVRRAAHTPTETGSAMAACSTDSPAGTGCA